MDLECDLVRSIVLNSALGPAVENHQIHFDSVLVTAFRERYWPETGTFHFGFGEITVIPDDAKETQGLQLEGKAVFVDFDSNISWDELYTLAKDVLGWSREQAIDEFIYGNGETPGVPNKKTSLPPSKSRKILLTRLVNQFGDTLEKTTRKKDPEVVDAVRARHIAGAFLLHFIGTVLFPDHSGNKVSACWLKFLKDIDLLHEYSWGTATVAYLHQSLAQASRAKATQIQGNVGLLQVNHYGLI